MNSICIATQNSNKVSEFKALLEPTIAVQSIGDFSQTSPAETGLTFVENAIIKARHCCRVSGLPSLADDSGICVVALNGAPGVISARYALQKDADFTIDTSLDINANNNAKLLQKLQNQQDKRAYFYCSLVYLQHESDPAPIVTTGQWRGQIAPAAKGEFGFGYDPIFIANGFDLTAAQIPLQQKVAISHRGIAMHKMLTALKTVVK